MNATDFQVRLLDFGANVTGLGLNWFLQSSLLLGVGLLMGRLLRRWGSAAQSVVYRTTLVAVLVCPAVTWMLATCGFAGWSIDLPAAWGLLDVPETMPVAGASQVPEELGEATNDSLSVSVPRPPAADSADAFDEYESPVVSPVPLVADSMIAPEMPLPASPAPAVSSEWIEDSAARAGLPEAPTLVIHRFGVIAAMLSLAWFVTAAVLLGRIANAWRQLSRIRKSAAEAEPHAIARCREVAALLRVPAPDVRHSPYLTGPYLAGLRRSVVLLPETPMSMPVRDAMIHELAHLRRRDCHWNLLHRLATAVFFFQPLLWRLSFRLEETAEEVCDDYVVQYGGDRRLYAHRLVDIAELSSAPFAVHGVSIVSLRSLTAKRVARIMDTSRSLSTRAGRFLLTLVIVGGLVGTAFVGLVGIRPQPSMAESGPAASETADAISDEGRTEPEEPKAQTGLPQNSNADPSSAGATEKAVTAPPTEAAAAEDERDDAAAEQTNRELESEIRGRVVGADGKPVASAKFFWFRTRVHDLRPMKPRRIATTNKSGTFVLLPGAMDRANEDEPASWAYRQWIVVRAPGHGMTVERPGNLRRKMPQSGGILGTLVSAVTGKTGVTIQLRAAGDPICGRLVDMDGQPVVGATVRIRWFNRLDEPGWRREAEVRDAKNAAWRARVNHLLNIIEPAPLRDALPMATTNDDGRFALKEIGPDRMFQLLVEGNGIESTEILVRNQPGETVEIQPERHSEGAARKVYGKDFLHVVGPSKPVEGRVVDIDTGEPIADALVRAYLIHGNRLHTSREREQFATRTDKDGRYRITGLPIGDDNRLVAFTTGDMPYIPAGYRVDTSAEGESARQDFRLKRGVWAEGRVYDAEADQSFVGEITYYYFSNPDLEASVPGLRKAYVDGAYWTNANGEFRLPVLPGRGILAYRYSGHAMDRDGIDRYPRGYGAEWIDGADDRGGLKLFRTRPNLMPSNYQRVVEVHPTNEQETVRADMLLVASRTVTIRVVDEDGRPVKDYQCYGAARNWGWQRQEAGEFEVKGLKPQERRKVFVYHRQRNLAGVTIVDETNRVAVEIKLQPAGRILGRLIDSDGEPITDATVWTNYEKLRADDDAAIWAPHPELSANPTQIPVDEDGRFRLDGLIPGKIYSAHASAPRNPYGEMVDLIIGSPFDDVRVQAGEEKDLGDIVIGSTQGNGLPKRAKAASAQSTQMNHITGQITDSDGQAIAGAHVAAIGMRRQVTRGGDLSPSGEVLAEGTSGEDGRYQLSLQGASSKTLNLYANVIARKNGLAIAWQKLDLDARDVEMSLVLPPEEPIQGRLVDIEGQPATGVRLWVQGVMKGSSTGVPSRDGVGYRGGGEAPPAWLQPVTSDEQGRFTLRGIASGHGLLLNALGDERFAPQGISLNTGMPEQRGERDGTYRSLVKNAAPGEEVVLPLAPAQLFEGLVTFADTGKPAPHARLTIWASQQQEYGSMVSVAGQANADGRYRISPKPGIRFGVTAYAPDGTPYLARRTPHSEAIRWKAGDRVKQVDMRLPRGILVRGKVVEAGTATPVARASIQYKPESANNSHTADDILTGWQAIQLTNEKGEFEIAVLPGPGRLLVHGQQGNFVLQETSDRELSRGTRGGWRNYVHALHKLNLEEDAGPINATIELQPGATVSGRVVDDQGDSLDEVLVISRLAISALSLHWRGGMPPTRGGTFTLTGLEADQEYPVYFLDTRRRIGATATIGAGGDDPIIVLHPCGEATAKFVDAEGQPHAGFPPALEMVVTPGVHRYDFAAAKLGRLAADGDFVANIDRTNYWPGPKTDDQGRVVFPALIPGATYQIVTHDSGSPIVAKRFSVESGERLDPGEVVLNLDN
ncbi:MAG: M56 family metallopeptidase [Pirellulaceae bacterium]